MLDSGMAPSPAANPRSSASNAIVARGHAFLGRLRYQSLRLCHLAAAARALPRAIERLDWSAERLRAERQTKLRALIAHARANSPWHARRLADIDPTSLIESDMARLPVMTKDDLMNNFDEIVTDRRLSLAMVNEHLGKLREDQYLLGTYHALSSGGSSGRRGVFVYDWNAWTTCFVSMQRFALARMGIAPSLRRPVIVAQVAANQATHMTSAIAQTFATPLLKIHRFPVNLPFEHIVAGLNALQPMVLQGYPSMLRALAHESVSGRLTISPSAILSIAEPLFHETRAILEQVFRVPVHNWWGTSEGGGMGMSCGAGPWMHLSDDTLIIEPVDAARRPVAPGTKSDKLLVTNLYNHAMPIIRYEISDAVTVIDGLCPCGSVHRRVEDVQGRFEDAFVYSGGVIAHPVVFRDSLANHPDVIDYQVIQRRFGAEIRVLQSKPFDCAELAAQIEAALTRIGLPDPTVEILPSEKLERSVSGKLSRFVPLSQP